MQYVQNNISLQNKRNTSTNNIKLIKSNCVRVNIWNWRKKVLISQSISDKLVPVHTSVQKKTSDVIKLGKSVIIKPNST